MPAVATQPRLDDQDAQTRRAAEERLAGGGELDPPGEDDEMLARGDSLAALSMKMRVLALQDVFVTKLMALGEHAFRFEGVLRMARALQEQDWEHVRTATASPFARAFFATTQRLGIVPAGERALPAPSRPRSSAAPEAG